MKIFILGKVASITHWLEDCVASLRAEGHQVAVGATRNPAVHGAVERLLYSPALGAPLAARLARRIRGFSPGLILAIDPYHFPAAVLEAIADLPARPPLVGWVGHVFSPAAGATAAAMDLVAYTDSGFIDLHRDLGFKSAVLYLPHAVNPHMGSQAPTAGARDTSLIFVGNPTPHRRAIVGAVRAPIALYGPGWTPHVGAIHVIHAGRVEAAALPTLYGRHLAGLNIRNERHVLNGLNQRNFQPYLVGTPLVTDDQPDLLRCFEPGKEVFVFHDTEELNAIGESLRRSPATALAAGENGRRRVLRDHTYARRLEAILAQL